MGFDFIVIAPLLPSHCTFSFVFGCGVSIFFGEFQCLPVDDRSAVSCDSGALARGNEHTSFYSAISNQSWLPLLLKSKEVARGDGVKMAEKNVSSPLLRKASK